MIYVSFLSIITSSFALILGISIMQGLHATTIKSVKGIVPDITIQAPRNFSLDIDRCIKRIKDASVQNIISITPYSTIAAVTIEKDEPIPLTIIGINQKDIGTLYPDFVQKSVPGTTDYRKDTCIISSELEDMLKNSSTVSITIPSIHRKQYSFNTFDLTKHSVYTHPSDTGYAHTIFVSPETLTTLDEAAENTRQSLAIRLSKNSDLERTSNHLKKLFPQLEVATWADQYPDLTHACSLELYGLMFLLFLFVLAASMNLCALTSLLIHTKARELSILAFNGMTPCTIRNIFYVMSSMVTMGAYSIGLVCALGSGWLINHFKLISLPASVYYTPYLPAEPSMGLVFYSCILFIAIAALTTTITLARHNFVPTRFE